MIHDGPGMLRQLASIVYSDSCMGEGCRIIREVSASVTVVGSADHLALLVWGGVGVDNGC